MKIIDREINQKQRPYVIAELSGNHNGSIKRAIESIKAAKLSGASAVKLQTYTANTMTIDCDKSDFIIKNGLWKNYKLWDLYKEAHTPYEWHEELFTYAKELGITLFSTPFDESAVDLLEKLNSPAYKIASFELTDINLIKLVATTKKPLLMSTGMASKEEISGAVEAAKLAGADDILLFHCISSYPAPIEEANLKKIKVLRDTYQVEVGLSDHTSGNIAAIVATSMGASAIEKHFTIDKLEPSPDSTFSIDPEEMKLLITDVNLAWESLGSGNFERSKSEMHNKIFRRSLYFTQNISSGEVITSDHIKRIRPGYGLSPEFYNAVIGKKVIKSITKGTPVSWDLIAQEL